MVTTTGPLDADFTIRLARENETRRCDSNAGSLGALRDRRQPLSDSSRSASVCLRGGHRGDVVTGR